MFLDDFDPYSRAAADRRSEQRRRNLAAFRKGLREATPMRESVALPLPHGEPSDRALPRAEFVPRRRGVTEKEADWAGTRSFLVVAESGAVLMDVTVAADCATDRFVHSLWRFLEREDPRGRLKAL